MDNFPAQEINKSSDKPLVYSEKDPAIIFLKIKNFVFNKMVIKVAITILLISSITVMGLLALNRYTATKKMQDRYQEEKLKRINKGEIAMGIDLIALYGEVVSLTPKEIILRTNQNNKIIKIDDSTNFLEIPLSLMLDNNKDLIYSNRKETTFSIIKKEDFLGILGDKKADPLVAKVIIIYK